SESSPEVHLNQLSNTSLTLIRQASRLLANQQWEEAIEAVRGIVRTEGDRLIAVNAESAGGEGRHYLTVQQYAQGWFAALAERSPEALVLYRRQVDPLARRWYREAVSSHDQELLQRLVDELFASSYGDDALLLLGEYRLERGDYAGARSAWERVFSGLRAWPEDGVPGGRRGLPLWMQIRFLQTDLQWQSVLKSMQEVPGGGELLFYPDSDLDRAAILARMVLVSILERHDRRARQELECLRRLYPESQGRLAAKSGSYVAILEELLAVSADWEQPPGSSDWTTFAGTATRSATSLQPIDIRQLPVWFQSLQHWSAEQELMSLVRPRIAEDMQGVLSYFPVIHDDLVYVNEQARIRAFRLLDGSPAWNPEDKSGTIFDAGIAWDQLHPGEKHYGVVRGTLTIGQNKLFAKVGSAVSVISKHQDPLVHPVGYLIGLDLSAEGKLLPGFPLRPDGPNWAFEGTPLIADGQLYVGMRRHDQVRSHAYLACFRIDTAQLKWRVLICSAETPGQGQWPELTHHLVSLDHGMLYYNTNAGAVAAVRASDGAIRWMTTYPRMTFRAGDPQGAGTHFFRDLNPCLIHRGVVVIAPSDSQHIFALEAATGQLLWTESSGQTRDVVHLLGVVGDDLVASGDYLYWLDLYNGRIRQQFPSAGDRDLAAARPSPRGLGRGLIAGDEVYWPTRESIYVFRSGSVATRSHWRLHRQIDLLPRGVTGGHLVVSNDRLLLVTATRLFAFRND
ncbi:MAG TPA: hypothetical protein EYN70_10485, partial [Planctomycetaceae bacterium]|nr:hypothetical protein [Planctomycetaceae bacterium]